ncbi:LysR family transcriptional regulator [Ramlibacter sp. G-1-2-2]|uniref:LysR family transcriptional regulator n=1 Tax=Ramlibacter agri TaxID=2728837 RepID=A0A848H1E3_9BURK|nr:LysR family transcriptional regulator [Ramlibacter agri]NML44384.1 LysR family transcriptional regulator [Ramlibacter agri]
MKNATFRQLRVFTEVARHLSFAKAARALHLTPPAVTMQVKELEAQIGLPLFERSGREVSLTTPGELMLVYARKLLATLKDAEDAAARLQRAEVGTLTIGMVSTAMYFLPRLLAEFRREHPHVAIKLAEGNREKLVQMLQANEVDLAVMGRPPRELATRAEPFAAHPHVFVAAPSHPLARVEAPIDVESLRPQDFIVREEGSGTRAAMEKFFADARLEPRVLMEMGSNETIKQAVMAGMGVSFLSLHTLELELEKGLLVVLNVQGAPVLRTWHVVHTLSKVLSPAAEAFRYFVLENGEAHLAAHFGEYLELRQGQER